MLKKFAPKDPIKFEWTKKFITVSRPSQKHFLLFAKYYREREREREKKKKKKKKKKKIDRLHYKDNICIYLHIDTQRADHKQFVHKDRQYEHFPSISSFLSTKYCQITSMTTDYTQIH